MKKSMMTIVIILFGFSGLCFGELPDHWNDKIKVSYMGIMILKLEMRLRDNFIMEVLSHYREDDSNNILPRPDFIDYLPNTKKIKYIYFIVNKELYLSLTSVEKEVELNKHVNKIADTSKKLINEITIQDLSISFYIDNVEVSTLENGKLNIK